MIKIHLRYFLTLSFSFLTCICAAQTKNEKPFTFSGYGEIYFGYNLLDDSKNERPDYNYNHKLNEQVGLNLAMAKVAYNQKNTRANLALMVGNYAQYNLATEPTWAQFVMEANAGIKLSNKSNIWLDMGIMPSHIGFESAISADCWTASRSLAAENSPYYEAGVKLGYTSKNEKLSIALFYLNGWQKIQKPANIQSPSVGLQINYKPNDKLTLNYSNFIGTDRPQATRSTRWFHNFYAIYEPSKKFGLTAGVDFGQENLPGSENPTWVTPQVVARFAVNKTDKIAARAEWYSDPKLVILSNPFLANESLTGFSLNYDKQITDAFLWRTELKLYQSSDKRLIKDDLLFLTTISVKL